MILQAVHFLVPFRLPLQIHNGFHSTGRKIYRPLSDGQLQIKTADVKIKIQMNQYFPSGSF